MSTATHRIGTAPRPGREWLEKVGVTALAIPLAIPIILAAMCWQAFALMLTWNWFVPEMFGLRPLTLASAMALRMVVGLARYGSRDKNENPSIPSMFTAPAFGILTCWGLHKLILAGYLTL